VSKQLRDEKLGKMICKVDHKINDRNDNIISTHGERSNVM